jgi:hypothetical protein
MMGHMGGMMFGMSLVWLIVIVVLAAFPLAPTGSRGGTLI